MNSGSGFEKDGLYNTASFPVGTAVNMHHLLEGSVYKNITNLQFNSVTPENILKFGWIHPQENFYNWSETDALAGYCQFYNKRFHGHTLIWDLELPQWVLNFQGQTDDWENLFKTHIQTVVSRYKGRIHAWDVVNEAFNADGSLKETIWKKHLGENYIERAFQYTRQADEDAFLFYNDYDLENNPVKRKAVLDYFNALRSKGIKIDGIGLQCHLHLSGANLHQIKTALREVTDNGYLLHLSELEIWVDTNGEKNTTGSAKNLMAQAELISELVTAYKELDPELQYGITFWGFTDKHAWSQVDHNGAGHPLLYDKNFVPKPCYHALKQAL